MQLQAPVSLSQRTFDVMKNDFKQPGDTGYLVFKSKTSDGVQAPAVFNEIEKTLALDTTPVNWPVGRGRDFVGTIAVEGGGVRLLEGDAGRAGTLREMSIKDVAALVAGHFEL